MSEGKDEPKKEPVWKTIHLDGNRKRCFFARDEFYDCVRRVNYQKMENPIDEIDYSECREYRKYYRLRCPGSWIELFDRRNGFIPGTDVEGEN
ncbi:unnamed protein product [Rodentolepis nana]|uniref:Cytochrome c oxidase subunit n=1 Tax=Rodentolepis nana TaxID=102285 RepID=A0A0R3TAL2_RODNA|nr:unnamed protein product [Rodentolepis nana]